MKQILSALSGQIVTVLRFFIIANAQYTKVVEDPYEHIDFVSANTQEDCFVCGEHSDPLTAARWGEDNVAILDLNTFELLRLEINRYGEHGELITIEAGVMQISGMETEIGWVHASVFLDRGYADVDISGVEYSIDWDSVQNNLCQTCLDSIKSEWFGEDPPAELAVVSYMEKPSVF